MGTKARGELPLTTEDGQTYTLRLSVNGICLLQEQMGKPFGDIIQSVVRMDFVAIRAILFQALQPFHANEIASLDAAGDWIERLGGIDKLTSSLQELTSLNAAPARAAGKRGGPRPPGAQVGGTSARSSGGRGASA